MQQLKSVTNQYRPPKVPKNNGRCWRSALLGSGLLTGFPTIWAQNIKNVTLRQFGTGVSNINEIAKKVKEDLVLLGNDQF